jgi:hypothetical protein
VIQNSVCGGIQRYGNEKSLKLRDSVLQRSKCRHEQKRCEKEGQQRLKTENAAGESVQEVVEDTLLEYGLFKNPVPLPFF